jgi:hypothetical protein
MCCPRDLLKLAGWRGLWDEGSDVSICEFPNFEVGGKMV